MNTHRGINPLIIQLFWQKSKKKKKFILLICYVLNQSISEFKYSRYLFIHLQSNIQLGGNLGKFFGNQIQ